jgi:hypothetical protein
MWNSECGIRSGSSPVPQGKYDYSTRAGDISKEFGMGWASAFSINRVK